MRYIHSGDNKELLFHSELDTSTTSADDDDKHFF